MLVRLWDCCALTVMVRRSLLLCNVYVAYTITPPFEICNSNVARLVPGTRTPLETTGRQSVEVFEIAVGGSTALPPRCGSTSPWIGTEAAALWLVQLWLVQLMIGGSNGVPSAEDLASALAAPRLSPCGSWRPEHRYLV